MEEKQKVFMCPQTQRQCLEYCVNALDCNLEHIHGLVSDCEPEHLSILNEENTNQTNTKNPVHTGGYICRMDNAYIKMCYWDGEQWLDMWSTRLEGNVKHWMEVPYNF